MDTENISAVTAKKLQTITAYVVVAYFLKYLYTVFWTVSKSTIAVT